AESGRLEAHVFVARKTGFAFAAAEPGIHQRDVADLQSPSFGFRIRSEPQDLADGLMTHRSRQRHAAILQRQRFWSMTEILAALPDMNVAVTDTGRLYPDQNLRSRGLRRRLFHFLQGGVEISDLETPHRSLPFFIILAMVLKYAMLQRRSTAF